MIFHGVVFSSQMWRYELLYGKVQCKNLCEKKVSRGIISVYDFAEISHQPETVRDADKPSPAAVTHTALNVKRSHHSEVKDPLRTAGADPYEAYARRPQKRPEWNTLRPSKAFVPASERYPEALKRHRQESRRLRQIQLMTLMERNTHSRTPQPEPLPPTHTPQNHRPAAQTHRSSPRPQVPVH